MNRLPFIAIALALFACGPSAKTPAHGAASPQMAAAAATTADTVTAGTIKIMVPAGMVGPDYWIYLDGHLAGGPPHEKPAYDTVVVKTAGGWQLWGADGVVLGMSHEHFDGRLDSYINSNPPDPRHIFQATEFSSPPGTHSIQAMILSQRSTFPFAMTRTYSVEVKTGETAQVYIAAPDDWQQGPAQIPARAIRAFCPSSAQLPDFDELQSQASAFMAEPMVQVLVTASSGVRTPGQRVVTLALPAEQGGPREFDGDAILAIVRTVTLNNAFPSQDEIAQCAARYPEYAQQYKDYGLTIAVIDRDVDSFEKLANDLGHTP
jgi:hypothetical protein